jgi:putative hemolysin
MDQESLVALRNSLPRITKEFLDVEQVFRSKSPRLAGLIPGFVFNYLRRVIHENEMNEFLYSNREKWGLDFVSAVLQNFKITTEVKGIENLPVTGRYLIASNHPLGGMDGIALMGEVGKVRPDLVFPVNDILMNIPNLNELFIPINKHGSNAENIRIINNTFASDIVILYFPAGLVSRKKKGIIKDLEWKKTFLTKAKSFGRDIIPVHIAGRNSDFFYGLANLRKKMGIKANIEMLYLVDEMYNMKDKHIVITIGRPISCGVFGKNYSDQEWAGLLREHVYAIEHEHNREFASK